MKKRKITMVLCLLLAALLLFASCKGNNNDGPIDSSQADLPPSGGNEGEGGSGEGGSGGGSGDSGGGGAVTPEDEVKLLTSKAWIYNGNEEALTTLTVDEKNLRVEITQSSLGSDSLIKGSYIYRDGYMVMRVDESYSVYNGDRFENSTDFGTLTSGYVTLTEKSTDNWGFERIETRLVPVSEVDGILYETDVYGNVTPVMDGVQIFIPVDKIDGEYYLNYLKPIRYELNESFYVFSLNDTVSSKDVYVDSYSFDTYPTEVYFEGEVDTSKVGSGTFTFDMGPASFTVPYYVVDPDAEEQTRAYTSLHMTPTISPIGDITVKKGTDTGTTAFEYYRNDVEYYFIGGSLSVTFAEMGIDTSKAGLQRVIYSIEGVPTAFDVYVYEEGELTIDPDFKIIAKKGEAFDVTTLSANFYSFDTDTYSTVDITAEMLTVDTSEAGSRLLTLTVDGVEYSAPAIIYEAGQKKLNNYGISGFYDNIFEVGEEIYLNEWSYVDYYYYDYEAMSDESKNVTITRDMVSLDTSKTGWTTLTVTPEEGISLTFNIYVIESNDIENFSASLQINQIYIGIYEALPVENILLSYSKPNGTYVQLSYEDAKPYIKGLESVDITKAGTYYAYAVVNGFTDVFPIPVEEMPPSTELTGSSGSLVASTSGSDVFYDGYRTFALYKLILTESGTLTVESKSDDLDPYGTLFNYNLECITTNDNIDSTDRNFGITITLDAGTYYIGVGMSDNRVVDSIPFEWSFVAD